MKKILISALEASANLHFEPILEELKKSGDVEICGIFSSKFGAPLYESGEFSAMGFVEVLPLIFKAKKALKQMSKMAKDCDGVLLIDSPAFNILLAKAIKNAGIKTPITYYILPQVWAWKPHRVAVVERFCDNLASILPFDAQFYSKSNYVGHPLLDEICVQKDPNQTYNTISFMPGSRKSEISRLMPIFRELAPNFTEKKLLVVPTNLLGKIDEFYGDTSGFEIVSNTPNALSKSDFAFICSGTATLEAALIGTPFVLCYKAKAIDIAIAKIFVKLRHAGLANIIFDFMQKPALHEELIQDSVDVRNLLNAYKNCDRAKFALACEELREYLGHGSAKNVANLLLNSRSFSEI